MLARRSLLAQCVALLCVIAAPAFAEREPPSETTSSPLTGGIIGWAEGVAGHVVAAVGDVLAGVLVASMLAMLLTRLFHQVVHGFRKEPARTSGLALFVITMAFVALWDDFHPQSRNPEHQLVSYALLAAPFAAVIASGLVVHWWPRLPGWIRIGAIAVVSATLMAVVFDKFSDGGDPPMYFYVLVGVAVGMVGAWCLLEWPGTEQLRKLGFADEVNGGAPPSEPVAVAQDGRAGDGAKGSGSTAPDGSKKQAHDG